MDEPVKFINHEVTDSLDSSNAFEGPEKLLELWFAPKHSHHPVGEGLLAVPRQVWETMLDLVHCKVLSVLSYKGMASYVLSESSFFVYNNKLVLKTCGTTTLLEGLPAILDIVAKHVPELEAVPQGVIYSRRSFLFPDLQLHPHGSWQDEVAVLQKYFAHGRDFQFGKSQDEKWYLFTAMNASAALAPPKSSTATLQIMMCGLDREMARLFHVQPSAQVSESSKCASPASTDSINPMESSIMSISSMASSVVGVAPDDDDPGHDLGNIMTRTTKIDEIYPTTTNQAVDSFAFSPCGYSCNGIVNAENYFTIHVTPEHGYSYASFETNVPPDTFETTHNNVAARVLDIFKPQKFTIVLLEKDANKALANAFPGYTCESQHSEKLDGLTLWHKSFSLSY